MPFGTRVNFETAVIKDIYERLCWVYTTLRNTLVFDHKGKPHYLFDIISKLGRYIMEVMEVMGNNVVMKFGSNGSN